MSLGQIVVRERKSRNILLSLLFFCFAGLIGFGYLLSAGLVERYPHLLHTELPFLYLLSPALYLLYNELTDENYQFQWRKHWTMFLPLGAMLVLMIPWYLAPLSEKKEHYLNVFKGEELRFPEYLFLFGLCLIGWVAAFILFKLSRTFSLQRLKEESVTKVATFILLFSVLIPGVAIYLVITRNFALIPLSTGLLTLVLCFSYLLGHAFPELFQTLQQIAIKEKYRKSVLTNVDMKSIERKLHSIMVEGKAYQNENFSLNDLSRALELTVHQTSEYLNEKIGKNFATYVNEFRVEYAKQLLADEDKTILEIAYQAGFNSKSSFNRAFRKYLGTSPSEFRLKKSTQIIV